MKIIQVNNKTKITKKHLFPVMGKLDLKFQAEVGYQAQIDTLLTDWADNVQATNYLREAVVIEKGWKLKNTVR